MAYRHNNYEFVIDSSFRPYTFSELMQPVMLYKDAYEKAEEAYNDLSDKADKFKYLSETLPEGSKARQLYEGYATELSSQAADLAQRGLNMNNRRSLTNLKRRYQGEIGRLVSADEALQKEKELRRTMNAKDSSMLYAIDNMSIDDFLDNKTPNLYNISGTELYARGAAAGKAASSRLYSAGDEGSTLGGYYRKWVERNGYNAESINAFRANAAAIPELQQAADDILRERGVLDNLSGANLARARQSVLNGIIDGAVYQERINPVRDAGVMSAAERAADSRAREGQALNAALHGMVKDGKGGYVYDSKADPAFQKAIEVARIKAQGSSGGKSGYDDRNKRAIAVSSSGKIRVADADEKLFGMNISDLPTEVVNWTDIINKDGTVKDKNLAAALKNSSIYGYAVYRIPKGAELDGSGWIWDDKLDEDQYILIPRDSKREGSASSSEGSDSDAATEIPIMPGQE